MEDDQVPEADKVDLAEILCPTSRPNQEEKMRAYSMLYQSGVLDTTRKTCEDMKVKLENGICSTSSIIIKIMEKLPLCKVLAPEEAQTFVDKL